MAQRPPSRQVVAEAAAVLRRLLGAIDAGELGLRNQREVALVRRLQGVLAGWQAALGQPLEEPEPPS